MYLCFLMYTLFHFQWEGSVDLKCITYIFLAFSMSLRSRSSQLNWDIGWCEPSWSSEISNGIELSKAADKIVLCYHVVTKMVQNIHAPDVL